MIFIIIGLALVAFLAFGFFNASKLKHIHIQQEVEVDAPLQQVFDNVLYLKNFPKWSPFYEADPEQITEVKGEDGKVGAQFHWNGNGGKDLGFQEISEVRNGEYIRLDCDIQKPFVAKPSFEYSFKQVGDKVKVIQDFNLESGIVDCFFMWLFGAKKDMTKMNARGMELLKSVSES